MNQRASGLPWECKALIYMIKGRGVRLSPAAVDTHSCSNEPRVDLTILFLVSQHRARKGRSELAWSQRWDFVVIMTKLSSQCGLARGVRVTDISLTVASQQGKCTIQHPISIQYLVVGTYHSRSCSCIRKKAEGKFARSYFLINHKYFIWATI